MSTQSPPESAFIESMKKSPFYVAWVSTIKLGRGEHTSGEFKGEEIDNCNKGIGCGVKIESGSYVLKTDKAIFVFTIAIEEKYEKDFSDYSTVLQNILTFLKKKENDLMSLSARIKGKKVSYTQYYLQLVFPKD